MKTAVKITDKQIHISCQTNGGTEKLRLMDTEHRKKKKQTNKNYTKVHRAELKDKKHTLKK